MPALLHDSVLAVHQFVPALAPAAAHTLAADDPYAAPSAGGIDAATEYAWAANAERTAVWRSDSAKPAVYEFPPACAVVLLPRPLNAAGEPALLLAAADGRLTFWDSVADANLAGGGARAQVPLADDRVCAAARCDGASAVLATAAGRLFAVSVYVHSGQHHLAVAPLVEPRGLLGRWLGGSHAPRDIHRLVAVPRAGACAVLALGTHALQLWHVPAAAGAARLVADDAALAKTIAGAVLYASGRRYSAAAARAFVLADVAPLGGDDDALAVLYVDTSRGDARLGIATVRMPTDADGFRLTHVAAAAGGGARAADPSARLPRLVVGAAGVAFVVSDSGVGVTLLSGAGFDEALTLRAAAGRILGADVAADGTHCALLTTRAGVLDVAVDVGAAAAAPDAATRVLERLERAVWFGEDPANPLQLDTLDEGTPPDLVGAAAERLSARIVASALPALAPAVDLRAQLAQRVTCALALVRIIAHNGLLARLAPATRVQLRADAELLAGALDMWRFYDESGRTSRILHEAVLALGDAPTDAERFFFHVRLAEMPRLLERVHAAAARLPADASLEATRLVVALFLGAARFRAEHGELYDADAVCAPRVPWYAARECIALLEFLYGAALQMAGGGAGGGGADAALVAELRTHLCVLAEALIDAHAARVAATADTPDAPAARAAYDAARPAVLHPLVALGRADRAFALAEHVRDFATLTALCFADEAPTAKRARREPAVGARRVEHYLDEYGAPFAAELYTYYVQHGALRRLLEPQPEHAPLVSAFLAAHPEYDRIAWAHCVALGDFAGAGAALLASARAERASIDAQRGMLSLGKLAHTAALGDLDAALRTPAEQARLEAWDDALDVCHVQLRLAAKWSALAPAGAAPEARAEAVADAAAAPALAPVLRTLFVALARGVAAGSVVGGEDLVDLLSLQSAGAAAPHDAALDDFSVGVQLLARLDDVPEPRRAAALAALWRRVYAQDDWAALSHTAARTDDEVLDEVRHTLAFRTVQAVLGNESTAHLVLAPAAAADAPVPDAALLAARFPGMPHAQIRELAAALAAERAHLHATLAHTSLGAFFDHVLARPIAFE